MPLAAGILWAMAARTLTLGDTEITRIGLGTNRLRQAPENVELIRQAVAAGIGMVDTAHTYTDGQSEATIGEALSPRPDGMVVATKGGYHPGTGSPEALSAQIEESLRRLRTETIDLYYLHRVDPETPLEESLGAIAAYRERGQIRHVGLSEVGIEQLERGRQVVPIAAVQNRYNLAERTHEEVVDHCAEQGIAFVPFFPLRGLDAPPGRGDRRPPRRDARAGRARVAPGALAGDAPDPGHPLTRPLAAEPRRARARAERRRARQLDVTDEQVRELARDRFGFDRLRPGQLRAAAAAAEGRDVLAVLPTGGGKSAIYELAGLLLPGPTIVVSPLIALQDDQLAHLRAAGLDAIVLNSHQSAREHAASLAAASEGRARSSSSRRSSSPTARRSTRSAAPGRGCLPSTRRT